MVLMQSFIFATRGDGDFMRGAHISAVCVA